MEHFPLVDRLHQDVLEEKYGPIHAKVLKHNHSIRESHLVDVKEISRTYALTFFPNKAVNKDIYIIDREIRSGGTIGGTFRKYGYAIRKNVLEVYVLNIPEWLKLEFNISEKYAKARISEFYAKKRDKNPVIYGTVLEIYSPDFRQPILNTVDVNQINPSTRELEKKGFSKEDIWRRIGNNNEWADVQLTHSEARVNSLPKIFKLKKRIEEYLKDH